MKFMGQENEKNVSSLSQWVKPPRILGVIGKTMLLVLFSLITIIPAQAFTGEQWLSQCKGITNIQRGSCLAYIRGLDDMHSLFNQLEIYSKQEDNYSSFPKICYPKGVTFGQLKKILTNWLNEHPEKLHEELRFLYIFMMRETFSCKTK